MVQLLLAKGANPYTYDDTGGQGGLQLCKGVKKRLQTAYLVLYEARGMAHVQELVVSSTAHTPHMC